MKINLKQAVQHLREREYMSGIERDKVRIQSRGEVFTPTPLVQEILDQLDPVLFTDATKTFIDPSCGDGQFLSEVVVRKLQNGHTLQQALSTTYGVDLMPDNVKLTQDRLLCGHEGV
jgi:type I restriction-modification system DNA methylase subunit